MNDSGFDLRTTEGAQAFIRELELLYFPLAVGHFPSNAEIRENVARVALASRSQRSALQSLYAVWSAQKHPLAGALGDVLAVQDRL